MNIMCFASAKGGAGKTVISASVATVLGALGKSVLLVDTDAATNGLTLFHLNQLLAAISARRSTAGAARPLGIFEATPPRAPDFFAIGPSVNLIPASFERRDTEQVPLSQFSATLGKVVREARDSEGLDYVILDAQAGADIYAQAAMACAQQVVIVSEYDPVSLAGVDRLRKLFPDILGFEKHWILLNKLLPEFARSFNEFLSLARYLPPIPWDADVVRAYAAGRLPLDMEHGNDHTLAVMRTVSALIGPELDEAVRKWRKQRESEIRAPIQDQLKDLENRISRYQEALREIEYQRRLGVVRPRWLSYVSILTGAMAVAAAIILRLGFGSGAVPTTSLLTVAVTIVTVGIGYRLFAEQGRIREELAYEDETEQLRSRINELDTRRQSLRTLAESDLDRIVTERSHGGA
jgi:cellulose biosynthesis protein BcsQ